MSEQTLKSRSNRIAKLRSLRTIELNQLRHRLDVIRNQQQQLEKGLMERNGQLSQTLNSITQQAGSMGIHCEQIQIAWRFVDSLRSDIGRLRSQQTTLASEEDKTQHQMSLINNQIERFTEAKDQLTNDIHAELQKRESFDIEDQISTSWGRHTG